MAAPSSASPAFREVNQTNEINEIKASQSMPFFFLKFHFLIFFLKFSYSFACCCFVCFFFICKKAVGLSLLSVYFGWWPHSNKAVQNPCQRRGGLRMMEVEWNNGSNSSHRVSLGSDSLSVCIYIV